MRILVILFAVIGCSGFLAACFPTSAHTAFSLGGMGVTYLMLGALAAGFCAYKVTK